LTKEQHTGRLVEEWKAETTKSDHKLDTVDISSSLSAIMAVKDVEELVRIRNPLFNHKRVTRAFTAPNKGYRQSRQHPHTLLLRQQA